MKTNNMPAAVSPAMPVANVTAPSEAVSCKATPVSYTHLDVYKRQGCRARHRPWCIIGGGGERIVPDSASPTVAASCLLCA